MELKNFALGRYSDHSYLLKGLESRKYALLNNYQQHLLQQFQERKHFLFVLFQSLGVGTKSHFKACFDFLKKLNELDLIATSKPIEKQTSTSIQIQIKGYEGMYGLAEFIFSVWQKIKLPPMIVVALFSFLASFGISIYVHLYELVYESEFNFNNAFLIILLSSYIMVCFCLSWRSLLQAMVLGGLGRQVQRPRFEFIGPFFCLNADKKDIWLDGIKNRAALAFVGIIAPLSIAGIFSTISIMTLLPPIWGFIFSFPCILTSLILACPLHQRGDGAELLHCILANEDLEQNLLKLFRKASFYTKAKKIALFVFCMFLWSFVWTDLWRTFLTIPLPNLVDAIYFNFDPGTVFIYKIGQELLYLILLYPALLTGYMLVFQIFGFQKDKSKDPKIDRQPLTFQEQNIALSKVPLFVGLSEDEAKTLFGQMETKFFADKESLVAQGDIGNEFFVIVRGKAIARYIDSNQHEHVVGHLQVGDAFGEVALLDEVPRTASIISNGGCYAVSLKKEAFQAFVEKSLSPEKVKQLIRLSSFFKKHLLLQKLEASDLAAIIENLQYDSLTPREEIPANMLQENYYVVYSGQFKVDTGDDRTDFILSPEDSFGFSPMSTQGVQGKVSSIEGGSVIRISKIVFIEYVWDRFLNHPELLWSK